MNSSQRQEVKLSWEDPVTSEYQNLLVQIPIALGRQLNQMPGEIAQRQVSRVVLNSSAVSRYHALIDWENNSCVIRDRNSKNGILINGQRRKNTILESGDVIEIGPYEIIITWGGDNKKSIFETNRSQIFFNPITNSLDSESEGIPSVVTTASESDRFPPPEFATPLQVSLQDIYTSGLSVDEIDYLTIGAGIGSFVFVDCLRIFGVTADKIIALGIDRKPYSRYKQLCLNSQIPLKERLRSNSDSCPDNIWGFPSYAWREAWHDLLRLRLFDAIGNLWQVFAEPTLAQTYTPRAGNVFDSIDREIKRIGWQKMYRYGRVLAIRKTTDGRYAIAYSRGTRDKRERAFLIANYLYLATGYPAIKFLPDLQAYREETQDFQSVVNAYEAHDYVYENLKKRGGTVLIRGRGIVASRIIQRIYETRRDNPNIGVIHLMRSPKPKGNKFKKAERFVENHFEFQPFNWPKACWGGDLRFQLERADSQQRQSLIADWGGTTTAARKDWRDTIDEGLREGWYKIEFGQVEKVEKQADFLITYIKNKNFKSTIHLQTDYIIDATGLDADVKVSPLLNDLVTHYNLPLNFAGRLAVSNDFEIEQMRNSTGKIYAAGAITLGGPYAAVDSFLGLQYTALRAIESLAASRSPGLKKLSPLNSFQQWLKWLNNRSPDE